MSSKNEHRVLVLSAERSDADAVCATAAEAGIIAEKCLSIEDLCSGIVTGAGAAVIGQEVLSRASFDKLMATLSGQPAWSDFPVIFIAFPTGGWRTVLEDILGPGAGQGNFVVVQRPLSVEVLVTALRAALRARSRQYELRRSHELLTESEASLRALHQASSEVLYRMSPDWSELRGLSGGGFIADTEAPSRSWLRKYIRPDDQPHVTAAINKAILTKSTFEMEHRVLRVDGSLGWTMSRAIPRLDTNGQIVEWFGAASDITQRKQAEEALRESEERFRSLFESMDEGFTSCEMIYDEAGQPIDFRFLAVNSAFARQTGLAAERIVGRTVRQVIPDIEPFWMETYGRIVRTGNSERIDHFTASLNRHFELFAWRSGPGRFAVVFNDVTDRKAADERLRLAQKLESVGLLASGVAHDFNNLLTVIMGSASSALDECPSCEHSKAIVSAAERAAHLTKQLLAYAGKGQFQKQAVDISDIVFRSRQLLEASLPKRVNLIYKLAKDLPAVEEDPSRIDQILMNLVINAGEAVAPRSEGRLEVSTGISEVTPETARLHSRFDVAAGAYVWLEVRDNGAGMDEATLSRIFDPFFSTKFTGRGLGLAAVDGIVRSSKGFIDVRSAPNLGTTFRVFLPASEKKRPAKAEPPAQQAPRRSAPTVLVVDDEETVRRLASMILRRHGYGVMEARDGKHALDVLADSRSMPVVVLLDIAMPVMGGDELVPILAVQYPTLKVIITSGYPEEEASRSFLSSSVVGFLQKPYTAATLTDRIDEILGRAPGQPGQIIQFPSSA